MSEMESLEAGLKDSHQILIAWLVVGGAHKTQTDFQLFGVL